MSTSAQVSSCRNIHCHKARSNYAYFLLADPACCPLLYPTAELRFTVRMLLFSSHLPVAIARDAIVVLLALGCAPLLAYTIFPDRVCSMVFQYHMG